MQFGKAGDGGTYICNVKETNAGMSIEKTVLSDKDSNWKENKKAKVVCKSGTKLMFTAKTAVGGRYKAVRNKCEI